MKIRVDRDLCNGHQMCEALAPEVYRVDEETGFNEMADFEVPAGSESAALRGVGACPERAITVLDH